MTDNQTRIINLLHGDANVRTMERASTEFDTDTDYFAPEVVGITTDDGETARRPLDDMTVGEAYIIGVFMGKLQE